MELIPETGDSSITLENLRKILSSGAKVQGCEVQDKKIIIVFDDLEYHATGFKIGELCRPFAEFVVDAGLDHRVKLVERFLAALPDDLEGRICWPGFEGWEQEWDSAWGTKTPSLNGRRRVHLSTRE